MNTSHITTRAEILRRCQNRKGGITQLSKETGIPYADLYDAKHCRPMSIARENQIRYHLDLDPLDPPPVKRVAIDPTTEGVRKLPGHGAGKETLRTWRTTDPKQAAKLDAKLAADGFSGLQDMVDQYIAKNGLEAA